MKSKFSNSTKQISESLRNIARAMDSAIISWRTAMDNQNHTDPVSTKISIAQGKATPDPLN